MVATAQQPTATVLQPTATAQQPTTSNEVPPNDEPPILYISADAQAVNVRSCPGADCPRVDCLAVGSEISIVDIGQATDGSTWYGFTYTGGAAWVNAALTSPERPEDNTEKPQGCTMALATSPPPALPTQRPPTQRPAPPPVVGGCTCTGPDLDCADFSTHNEAQACHNKCMAERGFDVYRLDGDDNDGLACERLP
jgi:hypothetical protein